MIHGLVDATAHRLLAPLDGARAAVLRAASGPLAPLFSAREARVACWGLVSVASAFLLAVAAPVVLLVVGPLALGVPHLLADVRYLVAGPAHHRRVRSLLMLLPLLATFMAPTLAWGFLSVVGAAVIARGPWARRMVTVVAGGALTVCAFESSTFVVAFAHAHNLVALAIWWAYRAKRPRFQLAPLLVFAACTGLVFFGPVEQMVVTRANLAPFGGGLDVGSLAATLAPVEDPSLALRLVVWFAFAQAVHYGVWLRLVPEDARPRPGPRSFTSSYRALVVDCGRTMVVAGLVVAAALLVWALVDVAAARSAYLRVALFHGPLELACVAHAFIEGRRLGQGTR